VSSNSENDTSDVDNHIHYLSSVLPSGLNKMNDAQIKATRKHNRIICNRKIFYLFNKYSNMNQSNLFFQKRISIKQSILDDSRKVANQLIQQFQMSWCDLYNTLKLIRNTMDVPSLNLDKNNAVKIIGKIYENKCLKDIKAQ
jgi:hypothetical protein